MQRTADVRPADRRAYPRADLGTVISYQTTVWERERRPREPRGRDRRSRPHRDRARASGEGLLQGRPSRDAARARLPRGDRALGDRPGRGRVRDRRLRAAVRRAVAGHRAQRLAAGGLSDRGVGEHDRPPVRLRPAGRRRRHGADRLRRARRRDRLGRRAHGPQLVRRPARRSARSSARRSPRPSRTTTTSAARASAPS